MLFNHTMRMSSGWPTADTPTDTVGAPRDPPHNNSKSNAVPILTRTIKRQAAS